MTKNRTPTPVYLDPGMHPGLEVKGLKQLCLLASLNRYIYIVLDPSRLDVGHAGGPAMCTQRVMTSHLD